MPVSAKKGSTRHRMGDDHRAKIVNSSILNRLIRHAEGLEDMGQSEVNAGLALLKKVMPDLKSVEVTGEGGGAMRLVVQSEHDGI